MQLSDYYDREVDFAMASLQVARTCHYADFGCGSAISSDPGLPAHYGNGDSAMITSTLRIRKSYIGLDIGSSTMKFVEARGQGGL